MYRLLGHALLPRSRSQVLLALMVTCEGLPIGLRLHLRGTQAAAHEARHQVERTGVAERRQPRRHGTIGQYVVGARWSCRSRRRYRPGDLCAEGSENRRVGEWEYKGRRLIVVFCPERARKDAHERRHQVERLLDRLAAATIHCMGRSASPSNARLTLPEKIAEAERWESSPIARERHRSDVSLPLAGAGPSEGAPHLALVGPVRHRPPRLRACVPRRHPKRRMSPVRSALVRCSVLRRNRATATSSDFPRSRRRRRNRSRPWGCP